MDCSFYLDMLDNILIKENLVVNLLVLLLCSLLYIYHSTLVLELCWCRDLQPNVKFIMAPSKYAQYFNKIDSSTNRCKICLKNVKGTNTSNMKSHVQKWHTNISKNIEKQTKSVHVSTFFFLNE